MILQALRILADELNNHLNSIETRDDDNVVIGDIAQADSETHQPSAGEGTIDDRVVMTLVKVEEDKVLKNNPAFTTLQPDQTVAYHNPPIYVNLYVLFSINSQFYENALVYLSRVIRFFQRKNVFTHLNTPVSFTGNPHDQLNQFKLILDLYSPSFEEANYLWSVLGGKQLPFVMYKVRLLELDLKQTKESRGVISTISLDGNSKQ